MKGRRAGVVAGMLLLFAGAGSVTARAADAPTTLALVDFADSNNDGTSDYIIGTVDSTKRKCVANRTVSVIRREPRQLIDRTSTSTNGYWAAGGIEGINAIEGLVKVHRKVVRRGERRLVCRSARELFD